MSDVLICIEGRAGRITLNRPDALNALSYPMCLAIDAAVRGWATDPAVAVVLIDAAGSRAFCAGGDIAQLYAEARAGNLEHGRQFWRDEYRMNARIAEYPKPVVSLIQGFCMGGGVGLGCHARHRIVCNSSQIAMPECGIGLVPDVGGSHLLARAPGRLGFWLGTTGSRMGPGDAIFAGFADHYVPEADWPALVADLVAGKVAIPVHPAPPSRMAALLPEIDRLFAAPTVAGILNTLRADDTPLAAETLVALRRVSPLAAACAIEILMRLGPEPTLRDALKMEYRFTHRAQDDSDFLEGIRAAIIDKDRKPRWRHRAAEVSRETVLAMLATLGDDELTFEETSS